MHKGRVAKNGLAPPEHMWDPAANELSAGLAPGGLRSQRVTTWLTVRVIPLGTITSAHAVRGTVCTWRVDRGLMMTGPASVAQLRADAAMGRYCFSPVLMSWQALTVPLAAVNTCEDDLGLSLLYKGPGQAAQHMCAQRVVGSGMFKVNKWQTASCIQLRYLHAGRAVQHAATCHQTSKVWRCFMQMQASVRQNCACQGCTLSGVPSRAAGVRKKTSTSAATVASWYRLKAPLIVSVLMSGDVEPSARPKATCTHAGQTSSLTLLRATN